MHFKNFFTLLQYSFFPESTDEKIEIYTKKIRPGSSGNYNEKSTELLDEHIAMKLKQLGEINVFINRQRLQQIRLYFFLHKCDHSFIFKNTHKILKILFIQLYKYCNML